jgi:hypothetical protein
LLVRHTSEQRREFLPLVVAQRCEKGILMSPPNTSHVLQRGTPGVRQVELVHTTVFCAVAALDETSLFELIDEDDETTRKNAQLTTERLLTRPRRQREHPKNAGVRRREFVLGESLGELRSRVGTDLSE